MEVNIALLIMAIGLLGLFSLFQVGLRQSDSATSDTTQSAFADLVLNAMRSNAQMVTNWTDWRTLTNGNLIVLGITTPASPLVTPITVPTVTSPGGVPISVGSNIEIGSATGDGYLKVPGKYLKYSLHLETDTPVDPYVVKAWIQVTTRRYTDVKLAPIYATSFVYMGM